MPIYPEIKEQDPNEQLDFSRVQYGLADKIASGAKSAFNETQLRYATLPGANLRIPFKGTKLFPEDEPVNQTKIDELKVDRPGLEIPTGIPNHVADLMTKVYDNNRHIGLIGMSKPSLIGKIGLWAGEFAGGSIDPIALMAGGVGGKAASLGLATIASRGVESIGAKTLFGGLASKLGTSLGEAATIGAGTGAGFQAGVEAEDINKSKMLDEPYSYLQSLQNVGDAAIFGAGLGVAGKYVGDVLNRLFDRREFSNLQSSEKEAIKQSYTPWSKESDLTMREEAMGQMMNGGEVNIDHVMAQGKVDGGAQFREALINNKINIGELRKSLGDAHDNIATELAELEVNQKSLIESNKELTKKSEVSINESPELYQPGILKALKQSQFNEGIFGRPFSELPDNIQKYIATEQEISKLSLKNERNLNRQTARRIQQLKNRLPKILTPRQELNALRAELEPLVGSENYTQNKMYFRLRELSQTPNSLAQVLKNNLDTLHTYRTSANNLLNHSDIIDNMINHVDDTHPPVTTDELNSYGKSMQSANLYAKGQLPTEALPLSLDEHLANYSDEYMDQMAGAVKGDKDTYDQLQKSRERLKNKESFKTMIQDMVTCILKGGE